MLKNLRKFLGVVLVATALPAVAATTPLEFFEDFDGVSEGLPEGWISGGSSPFVITPAYMTGLPAVSGDNILFSVDDSNIRDAIVYTPMLKLAGGKECKVTFSFIAPGGTPAMTKKVGLHVKAGTSQTAEAQTISVGEVERKAYAEWTEFTFTFRPETDGEYCVSFQLHQGESTLNMMGSAAIENVEILGESPAEDEPIVPDDPIVLEPDPENEADAVELPYMEDFEGDNYDGTTYVPVKWLSTGTIPITTAGHPQLKALSGDYYLITTPSNEVRDERLYTPFFVLTAGTEYTVSYYLYHPGQIYEGETRTTTVEFTVGTQQEKDFHKSLDKYEGYNTEWELCEVKFIPEVSGAYCFSFALSSEAAYAGYVCIEDFKITAPGLTPSPKAKFGVSHNYDLMTSYLAAFPEQPVQLCNLSLYGESYEWSVDDESAVISDPTAKEPTITFSASGEYKVTLKVTNERSSRSTTKTLTVQYFANEEPETALALQTNAPDDAMIIRGMVPTFNGTENDFITGPNCYYYTYAERMSLPTSVKFYVDKVMCWYTAIRYKYINNSREDQFNQPFSVIFYGETDGKPDESKVFGSYTTTMVDVFGQTDFSGSSYGQAFDIEFPEPIEVEGPCYVTFVVDRGFDMDVTDAQIGASCMGLVGLRHSSEVTTLYAKPYAVPENSGAKVDEWCKVDRLDPTLKGVGLATVLWGKCYSTSGSIAIGADGTIVFDVRIEGDNIVVSGTHEGENVCLYNVNGALVAEVAGGEGSTVIDAAAVPSGFYIVKAEAGSKKIVK